MRAVFFLCINPEKDPVGGRVFEAVLRALPVHESGLKNDGRAVMECRDGAGNSLLYVPTAEVVSHAYPVYLPMMRREFGGYDFAGLVNWHTGRGGERPLLTAHSTGDPASGIFGPCSPRLVRNTLLALEQYRKQASLDDFATQTEGTHWSGVAHGADPQLIGAFPVPLIDMEIGSGPASWSNETAAQVLARATAAVFSNGEPREVKNILCVGGVHLERAYTEAVLSPEAPALAVAHIVPNAELARGGYDQAPAKAKWEACIASVLGGVQYVVFHDDVKSRFKTALFEVAAAAGAPMVKYRALRTPATLPLSGQPPAVKAN